MENKKQSFSIHRLPLCFWLFVAFWIVEQQNVCSAKVPEAPTGTAELQVSNGIPPDSLRKLHSQMIAQKEAINTEFATGVVSKKHFHLIALLVLLLGLVKAISIRRQRKAEEPMEPTQMPEDISKEMRDDRPQMPIGRGRRTRREYRKPMQPSKLPYTPQPGGVREEVEQPTTPSLAQQMVEVPEEERELYELRLRRNVMRSMLNISSPLIDELPGVEAIIGAIRTNVETAEKAEMQYDNAVMRNDPQVASIRDETVTLMRAYLDGARDNVLQIAAMARQHGEAMEAQISQYFYFADTSRLRKPLDDSWNATSIRMCVTSLNTLESIYTSLQRESEEQLALLNSLTFEEGREAHDFIQLYGALSALSFRRLSLETFSALDQALMGGVLQMHKYWMVSKLQEERIPLEVDTRLVEGVYSVLSKHRLDFGITAEMTSAKTLLQKQSQEIEVMNAASDIEAVTAAYERAKTINQQLSYATSKQKEKLRVILEQNPLSKDENAALAEIMGEIAESAVKDSEDFLRAAQSAYSEAGGKIEDVAYNPSSGKAILQKLATKAATKVMSAAGLEQEGAGPDTSAAHENMLFTDAVGKIEAVAKNACDTAHDAVQSARKGKKYKLDKEGFGSVALHSKTQIRVDAVVQKRNVELVRMRIRYMGRVSKEIDGLERLLRSVFMYPFRPSSAEWVEVGRRKEEFDREKAAAREADNFDMLPKHFEKMLHLSFEIWSALERERLAQFMEAISQPSGSS